VRFLKSEEERGSERIRELDDRARRDLSPERRWEYHVLRVGPKARAEHQLNELGAQGWQLVQVIETEGHLAFYMEREVMASGEPAVEPLDEPDETGDA
jgi:hypothetical protein